MDSPKVTIVNPSTASGNPLLDATKKPSGTNSNTPIDLYKEVGTTNVLDYFNSYNYLFTLSCLANDDLKNVNDVTKFSALSEKFIIAKSEGKEGSKGINTNDVVAGDLADKAKETVETFNKESAGRFDFYFDDMEIETLMSFDKKSGFSKATKLSFTIIEPYSLAGLLEALQVAAVAAGHPTYKSAPFLLKIEFKGYPDYIKGDFPYPLKIEPATRYFILRFTGLGVKADERGTRYSCKAVPLYELGFGEANKLKTSININGNTVLTILQDMFTSLNATIKDVARERKKNKTILDQYEIQFLGDRSNDPKDPSGYKDISEDMRKLKVSELDKENKAYKFLNPIDEAEKKKNKGYVSKTGTTTAQARANLSSGGSAVDEAGNLIVPIVEKRSKELLKTSVQFSNGANITDCITAILRDSEYGTSIFKGGTGIEKDVNDEINWFNIDLKTEPLGWDESSNKPAYKYIYRVIRYKVHYTLIPGFAGGTMDDRKLKVARTYNYLYTGKNVSVLSFNLEFNTLYFQNDPLRGGNQPIPQARDSKIEKETSASYLYNLITKPAAAGTSGGAVTARIDGHRLSEIQSTGETTGPVTREPYTILAQNLHSALLENVGMSNLEIEIIGDPVYLVQSGPITKQNKSFLRLTTTGEVDIKSSDIYVEMIFRNPIDIQDLEKGGQMKFGEIASFSGFYKVLRVTSKFSGGQFTQKLNMIRMPSQKFDSKSTTPSDVIKISQVPNQEDVIV